MPILLIVSIAVGIFLLLAIFSYNRLIALRNRTQEAFSDIDVQLKRRHDLVPNLVETVRGYAAHEREVFDRVTQARSQAMAAKTMGERVEAENALSRALVNLYAVSENYPQLRASENFLELQRELRDTEDKIQAARRFYNANVRDLNTTIEVFPSSVIASVFGFKKMEFFEIEEPGEREVPKVQF